MVGSAAGYCGAEGTAKRPGAVTMFRAVAPVHLRRAVSPGGEGRAPCLSSLNLLSPGRSV